MKAKINLNGTQLDIEYELVTLLEDPSISWTCKPGEFFIKILKCSNEKLKNQFWHSNILPTKTMKIEEFIDIVINDVAYLR